MSKPDGREIARQNELRVLKALHKFGSLRTRDLAALIWSPAKANPPKGLFLPRMITVGSSAVRMAQRTLSRLRESHQVFLHTSPDGSLLYGLSEGGARVLRALDIPAKSAKNWLRRFSPQQYHHRRIANEIAISAILQGYRASSEHEIAGGLWLGGMSGIYGKKPDVVVRSGKVVWFIEVERSRKNKNDHIKLLHWLQQLWLNHQWDKAKLSGEYELQQVVFVANRTFAGKLALDLGKQGWTPAQIKNRISHVSSLYVTDTKFLTTKVETDQTGPA
jgi:hypothetical protein